MSHRPLAHAAVYLVNFNYAQLESITKYTGSTSKLLSRLTRTYSSAFLFHVFKFWQNVGMQKITHVCSDAYVRASRVLKYRGVKECLMGQEYEWTPSQPRAIVWWSGVETTGSLWHIPGGHKVICEHPWTVINVSDNLIKASCIEL